MVDVPGTRELRLLPLESVASPSGKGTRTGSSSEPSIFLRLAMAALLLISFGTLSYGGYLAYLRWNAPIALGHTDDEFFQELYDTALADPVPRAWDHWNFLVDAGIPEDPEPQLFLVYNRLFEAQKPWMIGLLTTGGLTFLAFLGLSYLSSRQLAR